MENIVEISLVQKSGMANTKHEMEDQTGKSAEIASSLKVVAKKESDGGFPLRAAAVPVLAERNNSIANATNKMVSPVLTERNIENNHPIANSTSKMVSPVLLKLRRNQEKRVTPANPVNPVQVPPKQFLGFPAERYMSPTDSIMSPISRGLLARSRRSRLPPALVPPKALDHTFQDAEQANVSSS